MVHAVGSSNTTRNPPTAPAIAPGNDHGILVLSRGCSKETKLANQYLSLLHFMQVSSKGMTR